MTETQKLAGTLSFAPTSATGCLVHVAHRSIRDLIFWGKLSLAVRSCSFGLSRSVTEPASRELHRHAHAAEGDTSCRGSFDGSFIGARIA